MKKITRLLPLFLFAMLMTPVFAQAEGLTESIIGKTAEKAETVEPAVNTAEKEVLKDVGQLKGTAETATDPQPVPVDEVQHTVHQKIDSAGQVTKQTDQFVERTTGQALTKVETAAEKTIEPTISRMKTTIQPISEAVTVKKEELHTNIKRFLKKGSSSMVPIPGSTDGIEETVVTPSKSPYLERDSESRILTNPDQQQLVDQGERIEAGYEIVNGPVPEKESNVERSNKSRFNSKQKASPLPHRSGVPFRDAIVPAPIIPHTTSVISHPTGQDLGQLAFLEYFSLDVWAAMRWWDDEIFGGTQWIHAPPTKPPKVLSYFK